MRHVMQSSVLITTQKKQQFLKKELKTQRELEPRSRALDPTKVSYGSQSSDVNTPPTPSPPKAKKSKKRSSAAGQVLICHRIITILQSTLSLLTRF